MPTLTPAASVRPQISSRKLEKNMNKEELEGEVKQIRGKEELYKSNLNELKDETKSLKETIEELKKERVWYNPSRGVHKIILDLEKRTAE